MKTAELFFENTPLEATALTDQEARVSQGIVDRLAFDAFRRKAEEVRAGQFAQEIVSTLNPHYSWVADIEPSVLRDIFQDITSAREELAQQSGDNASDWHIYRHFRVAVEIEEPRERDMRTVLLLEALMNGDVRNGTLPTLPIFFL